MPLEYSTHGGDDVGVFTIVTSLWWHLRAESYSTCDGICDVHWKRFIGVSTRLMQQNFVAWNLKRTIFEFFCFFQLSPIQFWETLKKRTNQIHMNYSTTEEEREKIESKPNTTIETNDFVHLSCLFGELKILFSLPILCFHFKLYIRLFESQRKKRKEENSDNEGLVLWWSPFLLLFS